MDHKGSLCAAQTNARQAIGIERGADFRPYDVQSSSAHCPTCAAAQVVRTGCQRDWNELSRPEIAMSGKKKRKGGKKRVREINSETRDLATKMLGHFIPYEIGMMRALYKRLEPGSSSRLCRNSEIKSFHIHARNLMEFFKNDAQCAVDPTTFTTKDYRVEGDFIPRKLEAKISQQIVHLTHERTDVDEDKLSDDERTQTSNFIEKQIERFEKSLKPALRPIWEDGLRKMNFDEPIGLTDFRYVVGGTAAGPPELRFPENTVAGPTNEIKPVSSEPGATRRNFKKG